VTSPQRSTFVVRFARVGGLTLLVVLLALVGAYTWVHGGGNFHEVEKGAVYRSSLLGSEKLEQAIDRLGVKTVLNLCGEQPGVEWYEGEVEVSRRRGIKFLSMGLSANTALDASQLVKLTEALRDAPKPLLIHCRAGSDRTGLASAIYVATHGGSYHDAQNQLSLYYGHFPYLGSKSAAMGISLERFYENAARRQVVSQTASK
jgi:protein tyrosine/serine phosphatase